MIQNARDIHPLVGTFPLDIPDSLQRFSLSQNQNSIRYRVEVKFNIDSHTGEMIMLKNIWKPLMVIVALSASALACNLPMMTAQPAEGAAIVVQPPADVLPEVEDSSADQEAEIQPENLETEVVEDEETQGDPLPEEEETPTPEPVIEACTDRIAFIMDVTIPDDSEIEAGAAFTKTWRLRNDGTCTWEPSYDLVFHHGDHMSAASAVALTGAVMPGQIVDLSIDMVAPADPGTYQGFWMLRNGENVLFGLGAGGDVAFWAKIVVPEESGETVFIPQLLAQPLVLIDLFVSNGTDQTLMDSGCFDLDDGSIVSCGSVEADFRYNADLTIGGWPPVPHETHDLDPLYSASFGEYGAAKPTGSDCQALSLGGGDIDLDHTYYCYQTTDGKYGYIYVTSANLLKMSFDWATYTFP